MLPAPGNRKLYEQYLADKDEKMREAAAEGFARLGSGADLPTVQKAWDSEGKTGPRVSMAFALVACGNTEMGPLSPLRFLINNLNSSAYNGVARPFLIELARNPEVRSKLYPPLLSGTRDEKINLARVLAASGDKESMAQLQKLSNDPDAEVAKAALTAARDLQAKL
jgi:hypothetical protein